LAVREAGGTPAALAAVKVCATVASWKAAKGGPLADAPAADCNARAVPLGRDDAGVWRADLSSFAAGRTGLTSVVLIPDPSAAPVPGLAAYDISFEAPTLQA